MNGPLDDVFKMYFRLYIFKMFICYSSIFNNFINNPNIVAVHKI